MKKSPPAADPDAYVAALSGWRGKLVAKLRKAVRAGAKVHEEIKWGHLVYSGAGPAILIRAEARRVLLGFWRGKRLRGIEPRLKASGGYELATLELREGDAITASVAKRLAAEAARLDAELGDPRLDATTKRATTKRATKKRVTKKRATKKRVTKKRVTKKRATTKRATTKRAEKVHAEAPGARRTVRALANASESTSTRSKGKAARRR